MDDDPGDWLVMLSDALNEALGHPICSAPCGHGQGACSLPTDHEGDHETHGIGGEVFCTWPRREEP
jgi:hypothetical protein